ncbi:filamentation induced by cAMP protein fic [gamma proteobacterium BDW918]|jgi:hypothetical protein|uniref:Cell filamentation protein Fic n=1 Tax=Zhongshania aliphaticivorans TaxID=1470434 RepID=A0A127M409_9GAMM|nr:Fic family protein [Zhongshania aliphaticivorans]AMO67995.1 cell filamentation protein Fic [Zhongshania aliphaticivorans]EIF44445.1 filamentation induced by cAMP protein fic [gamma proteobacterium BDW918]
MRTVIGYSWLKEQYQLPVIDLWQHCYIDSSTRGRTQQDLGTHRIQLFEKRYQPDNSLVGHLQFALRYEGVNLQLLALLFPAIATEPLVDWISQSPNSAYARRVCFLYEWLCASQLPIDEPVTSRPRYVDVVDTELQFGSGVSQRDTRYRVVNNLLGTPDFCPMVRRTNFLTDMINKDLRQRTRETLAQYDQDLLRRAAAFLYLKETQSSFEVEREKPSADRAQRFADLLREADTSLDVTEDRLVELQQAVVDARFHEFTWRQQQNWVGRDLGYRQQIDFVPPRPEDVPALMMGLQETSARARLLNFVQSTVGDGIVSEAENEAMRLKCDPVVYAAIIAFGFVFIHPFMDGNGRIHRYLIHDVLANAGFTPKGIVLPVSAVILANLDEYIEVLEAFSKPIRARTHYSPDTPDIHAVGNDAVYFRFFDATEQAEFLYKALERTVEQDLQQEIDFLLGFDKACQSLNKLLDWPAHSLELFVRVVHQGGGRLSKTKQQSHFHWMTAEEIASGEAQVRQSFGMAAS